MDSVSAIKINPVNSVYKPGDITAPASRITSVDVVRGVVMIIMALAHVREFFHRDAFLYDPLDLNHTSFAVFFTRWIGHLCAPVFLFLGGTSVFLAGKRKSKKEQAIFLFTRGLWLMFLELTVVNFAWSFNIHFPYFCLLTIWALGMGMIVLALLIRLPVKAILSVGVLIVAGHNLLDNFHVPGRGLKALLWSFFIEPRWAYERNHFTLYHRIIEIGYPVLPWIGIMILGYCFGYSYSRRYNYPGKKKWLAVISVGAILTFIIVRFINVYGDPVPWSTQKNTLFTILSFLNVSKFPPSLLFTLVTLGIAIFLLILADRPLNRLTRIISVYGRVPMFYYLLHLYLIHFAALFAAELTGHSWKEMITKQPFTFDIKNYGFSLSVVYLIWILIVIILYPLCKWYDKYKTTHKEQWWLRYL